MSIGPTQYKIICPHCGAKLRGKTFPSGRFKAQCPHCRGSFTDGDVNVPDEYDVAPPAFPEIDLSAPYEHDAVPSGFPEIKIDDEFDEDQDSRPSSRQASKAVSEPVEREPWFYRFVSNASQWSVYLVLFFIALLMFVTGLCLIRSMTTHISPDLDPAARVAAVNEAWSPVSIMLFTVLPISFGMLLVQMWWSGLALIFVDIGRQLRAQNRPR